MNCKCRCPKYSFNFSHFFLLEQILKNLQTYFSNLAITIIKQHKLKLIKPNYLFNLLNQSSTGPDSIDIFFFEISFAYRKTIVYKQEFIIIEKRYK